MGRKKGGGEEGGEPKQGLVLKVPTTKLPALSDSVWYHKKGYMVSSWLCCDAEEMSGEGRGISQISPTTCWMGGLAVYPLNEGRMGLLFCTEWMCPH